MQKLSEVVIEEYRYSSEEERERHVKEMEYNGYECSGQVRKREDYNINNNGEWYWYGKFFKRLV